MQIRPLSEDTWVPFRHNTQQRRETPNQLANEEERDLSSSTRAYLRWPELKPEVAEIVRPVVKGEHAPGRQIQVVVI